MGRVQNINNGVLMEKITQVCQETKNSAYGILELFLHDVAICLKNEEYVNAVNSLLPYKDCVRIEQENKYDQSLVKSIGISIMRIEFEPSVFNLGVSLEIGNGKYNDAVTITALEPTFQTKADLSDYVQSAGFIVQVCEDFETHINNIFFSIRRIILYLKKMKTKELMINGIIYQYQQRYFKDDNLWVCTFADVDGKYAEVESGNLIAYDESLGRTKKELETAIIENDLKVGIDNEFVLWQKLDSEKQLKILSLARKIKLDLMSEWSTDDVQFGKLRNMMNARTGFVFPRTLFNRI